MKKLKTLLFASSLLVGFSSVSMAQSTDNATINANANVVQAMVVGDLNQDLDFGNILQNSAKIILPANQQVDATASGTSGSEDGITDGETRGFVSIDMVSGTNITLSVQVPEDLSDGSSNTLPISFDANGIDGESTTGGLNGLVTAELPTGSGLVNAYESMSTTAFSKSSNTWSTISSFPMPAGDRVFLVLGGEVSAGANQVLGTYSGDITITATVDEN
ncbi:hypothetical protein [Gracilimonas halophila]|uniref:DUF4402 domain-containing protein n=1 Tax=Gracilimonas halophila TaxID=1834464 RepID=A0ABW5JLI7_9BACT